MPEMTVVRGSAQTRGQLDAAVVGEMRVMSRKGDTRVTWNARDADEVAAAKAQFDDLRDKGFMAYAVVEGSGGKGEQLTDFDPAAQKIILAPPMAGGAPMVTVRKDDEIDRVLNWCMEAIDEGTTRFGGMTYEQGVENALRWSTGLSNDAPDEE